MSARDQYSTRLTRPSRRTFVKGLAVGGAAASMGVLREPVWAQTRQRQDSSVLSGTEFDLRIGETDVNLSGKARTALTINESLPGPLLCWKEGDTVTPNVANQARRPGWPAAESRASSCSISSRGRPGRQRLQLGHERLGRTGSPPAVVSHRRGTHRRPFRPRADELAPYIGLVWNRKLFGTADYAEAAGERTSGARLAVGVRLWM